VNQAIEMLKRNPMEHLGQRVVTLGQMDEVHGRPEGMARKAFNRHKAKLEEGRHFFRGSSTAWTTSGRGDDVLLTERGYLVLVKTFRDDLAWRVQEQLVDGYFRARELVTERLDGVARLEERLDRIERGFVYNGVSLLLRDQQATNVRLEHLEKRVDAILDEAVKIRRRQAAAGRGSSGLSRRDRRRRRAGPFARPAPAERQLPLAQRKPAGEA